MAAEQAYRRALELNSGDEGTRTAYAWLLATLGRTDESLAEARSAVERDPVSAPCRYMLALIFGTARRYEEAIAAARAGIELDPGSYLSYQALGRALVGLGRGDEAVEAFRRQVAIASGDLMSQAELGWALGAAGQREEAHAILGNLERQRGKRYVGGSLLALVCLGLGDHDQAFSWLQQAEEERDGVLASLKRAPMCRPPPLRPPLPSPPPAHELPRAAVVSLESSRGRRLTTARGLATRSSGRGRCR